jgi:subtilisin family serine protease
VNTFCRVPRCPRIVLLMLAFALLPMLAWARIPVLDLAHTEVVSARVVRHAGARGQMVTSPDLAVSGQILLELWPAATAEEFTAALQAIGGSVLHVFRSPGLLLVKLPAGMAVSDGVQRWRMEPAVKYADPDRLAYATRVPNDTLYATQYHLPLINCPAAWDVQTGSAGVVLAINDSGVWLTHEDLQSRIWTNPGEVPGNGKDDDGNGYIDDVNGWDFIDNDNDPNPDPTGSFGTTHGTHVAGIAAAASDNSLGVAGVDWRARIMAVRVLGKDGSGAWSGLIAGIDYASTTGASVINMSIGGGYQDTVTAPITTAWSRGVSVVVAAGNSAWTFTDDPSSWDSPVCNDGPSATDNHVIGVAATDVNDVLADFTNLDGSSRHFVDVAAPGVDILSCYIYDPTNGWNEKYGLMSGTSMACPVVAGIVAVARAQFPAMVPDAILAQITKGCDNIDAKNPTKVGTFGAGRVNLANALGDMPPATPKSFMAFDTPGDEGGSITLTWKPSTDDGKGANDVVGYDVWRGTEAGGSFDKLASLPKGTKTYVDTPVPDYTDFFYKLSVRDAVNTVYTSVVGPVQVKDDLAPPAITVKAVDTPADSGGSISLTWTTYTPPDDFTAYRVYRGTASFTQVTDPVVTKLTTIVSRSTKSFLDHTVVNNTDYWYAVTAVDDATPPNEVTTVTAVGPVRANPNIAFISPPGVSLLALGLQPQVTDLGVLFGRKDATMDFLRWDPTLAPGGGYHRYSDTPTDAFLAQALGRGFWLQTTTALVVDVSGAPATTDQQLGFAIGWNQLGNPFTQAVPISALKVRVGGTTYDLPTSNQYGYTADYLWAYDALTSSYALVSQSLPFARTEVRPGDGFFFFGAKTGQLLVPLPVSPAGEQKPAQVAAKSSSSDWSLRLVAAVDGAADTDNFLGVSPQAAQRNGVCSPPLASGGVDLFFPEQTARCATSFRTDLGSGQTWELGVVARPGSRIRLSWPDLSQLPRDCRPVLKDLVTGQSTYLRTSTGHAFSLGATEPERKFTLEISTKAGDLLAIRSLEARPAARAVQISYTLSSPATVSVDVLNLAGRIVRSLPAIARDGGVATTLWDGNSTRGSRAPAGTYLVRVTACAADGQAVTALRPVHVP